MLRAAVLALSALQATATLPGDLQLYSDPAAGLAIVVPDPLFPLTRDARGASIALASADERATLDLRITREDRFGPESFARRRADFREQGVKITRAELADGYYLITGTSVDGLAIYDFSAEVTGPACEGCLARLAITYPRTDAARYAPQARHIAESLRRTASLAAGAAAAEALTARNADVARWQRQTVKDGGTPVLSASGTVPDPAAPCVYAVHAYRRQGGSGTSVATFGWYDSDVCRSTVIRQPPD